jgi:hypothetical protein
LSKNPQQEYELRKAQIAECCKNQDCSACPGKEECDEKEAEEMARDEEYAEEYDGEEYGN